MNETPELTEQQQAIADMLRAGHKDIAIRRALGVHNRAVPVVRRLLGMPLSTANLTTPEHKLAKFSTAPDAAGHIHWNGRTDNGGNPEIRQRDKPIPASHIAFRLRTGRMPVGIVKPECGMDVCLAPEHISDELERRKIRMQLRVMDGQSAQPWDVCPQGLHGWEADGRIGPRLNVYCKSCNTARAARVREAKRKEGWK